MTPVLAEAGRNIKNVVPLCRCAVVAPGAPVFDLAWQNLRQTEGHVVDRHLMPYVIKTFSAEDIREVTDDFMLDGIPDDLKEHFFGQFLIPWLLFHWLPEDDFDPMTNIDVQKTIAMNYLDFHRDKLNSREKHFIQGMGKAYYSFYSIQEVVPEYSLTVKDALLGSTHVIKERQGTHHLKRGDVVFSRILSLDGQSVFVGMAPIIIPASYHTNLIDFRDWLINENNGNPLTGEVLRSELDYDLFDYFFEITDTLYNSKGPTLFNTDGDLILFSASHFKLELGIEETLKLLLPMALLKKPDEILESATRDAKGKIVTLEFGWLKKGNKKHPEWENTLMGNITIKRNKLILETNSEKRTQKGKKLLEKHLGDSICFQKTVLETPEQKMKSLPNQKTSNNVSENLLLLPEIQEKMKEMAKKHWKHWFDQPLPALKNQTPRQAAKSKAGQERLEALLLQYERYDSNKSDTEYYFKADINYIKSELNLK